MKYTAKQQLVIATETGSGVLTEICALLTKQRINIQDIYATEEKSKGMLHLIVDDTDAAEKVMREAGFIPLVIKVLVIDIKDSPGTLGRICSLFAHHGINIEYVYGSENVHHHNDADPKNGDRDESVGYRQGGENPGEKGRRYFGAI